MQIRVNRVLEYQNKSEYQQKKAFFCYLTMNTDILQIKPLLGDFTNFFAK